MIDKVITNIDFDLKQNRKTFEETEKSMVKKFKVEVEGVPIRMHFNKDAY